MNENMDDLLQDARRAFVSDAEHAAWADALRALVARERADAAEAMREAAIEIAEWSGAPIDTAANIRAIPIPDAAIAPQTDLTTPYKPAIIHYDEDGVSEFTLFDCATVSRLAGDYEILFDLDRHVVGFRWSTNHPPTRPTGRPMAETVKTVDAEELARLRAGVQAPRAPDGWKPIETAPTDGTYCLLFDPDNEDLVLEGGYREDFSRWISRGGMLIRPTRWRPLPAPPSDGGTT